MSDLVCLHPQFTKQKIIKTLKNELNGKERKGKMYGEVKGMETYQDFGKFIAAKRQEKEISLRKLAELLDVSAPYWSDVERGRRIPPTFEKLEQVAKILRLSDSDKSLMYDLAGKGRDAVAPDLPVYIMENDYVAAALRTVRDLGASEEDWQKFVEELKQRKG